MKIYKLIIQACVVCAFSASYVNSWAQPNVRKEPSVDTAFSIPNTDSLEQRYMVLDTVNSKFIESVEKTVKSSKLTRWMSSSVFTKDRSFEESDSLLKEDYSEYNGKIVRSVKVEGLGPYEKSELYPDNDSQSWLTKVADATHMNTRNFILRENLMVKPDDVFSNEMIINNLAYYRNLRYIYDARVIITMIPDSDYVDILFVVLDVWSIGFGVEKVKLKEANLELYDRNILGLGMELRTGIFYDRSGRGDDYLGFSVSQFEENIKGTFITSKVQFISKNDKKLRHVSVNRDVLPNLKTVGGLSYEYLDENRYFITIDTFHQVKSEVADAWFGRVFNLGSSKSRRQNRLATLVRYEYRNLRNSMPINTDELYDIYEDRNLYLASVSLYRQQYYTDRLLFGFGIHENIPYGYNLTLQAGHEMHRYGNRFYTSLSAQLGKQHSWGYAYSGIAVGGYLHGGNVRNGVVGINLAYFSPLIPVYDQAFRQFAYIFYERGIKRGAGEGSRINYTEDLLFELSNNDRNFFGSSKLTVSMESDFYSTVKLLGFRFVFFNFADLTWLGNKTSIFENDFLPGIGIGIRVRNDKLVFKTIQLKIGWYPKFPQSGFGSFYDISGVDHFRQRVFDPQKPQTLEFK